jgi:hypothetical protein
MCVCVAFNNPKSALALLWTICLLRRPQAHTEKTTFQFTREIFPSFFCLQLCSCWGARVRWAYDKIELNLSILYTRIIWFGQICLSTYVCWLNHNEAPNAYLSSFYQSRKSSHSHSALRLGGMMMMRGGGREGWVIWIVWVLHSVLHIIEYFAYHHCSTRDDIEQESCLSMNLLVKLEQIKRNEIGARKWNSIHSLARLALHRNEREKSCW